MGELVAAILGKYNLLRILLKENWNVHADMPLNFKVYLKPCP